MFPSGRDLSRQSHVAGTVTLSQSSSFRTSTMSEPTYIYKLVSFPPNLKESLPEKLPLSELDKKDKFIHLSTALQVPGTLKRFFAEDSKVNILRIKYSAVEEDVKWEDSKGKGTTPRSMFVQANECTDRSYSPGRDGG